SEPGLRGEVRLPLRRFRQPPLEGGDPRRAARPARADARGGARRRRGGTGRDRGGPVAALLGLGAYTTDWLNLLIRWLHVIAGIVWIGSSFYFIALDNHLRPPREGEEGVSGEAWELHGGGLYRVHKYAAAPRVLPEPLHWCPSAASTTSLPRLARLT